MIIWIGYIIFLIIGSEIFSYFWHKYGGHTNLSSYVRDIHKIHHMISLDENHDANEDFVWILLLILILSLFLFIGFIIGILTGIFYIITISVSITIFSMNWIIHSAFHNPVHFLHSYEWFQLEKERHFIHHHHPNKNYGIITHFMDKIMDTFKDV